MLIMQKKTKDLCHICSAFQLSVSVFEANRFIPYIQLGSPIKHIILSPTSHDFGG